MKTTGMKHQLEALRRMNGRDHYALFMEQGTGKTWTLLADAERRYAAGLIDGLLVVAPKGVHTNWVRREIPAHLDVPCVARAWRSGAGKREMERLQDVLKPREHCEQPMLRVLAINIDALNTEAGFEFARRFMNATRAMIVLDESSRIKNPAARRTKQLMRLRPLAECARIASGTPITLCPMDVFSQMEFLESGLLGTTSYRVFTAEYAELMSPNSPMMAAMAKRNPRAAQAQIVKKGPDGRPVWRNLDKLQRRLEPHSFRVLKKDCLDLPAKVYQTHYFDMSPSQRKMYELMSQEARIDLGDDGVLTVSELAALIKLQQITSGFVMTPAGAPLYTPENPRLDALRELLEDIPGKVLVWAKFREELSHIAAALRADGRKVVEYHGGVSDSDREAAVDDFQTGDADVFLGQPQAGGIGLTLTAAETVIYYSNDFNLETRLQSEDRAHRMGTKRNVVYIDLAATDSIDERIASVLQSKSAMAGAILGDA